MKITRLAQVPSVRVEMEGVNGASKQVPVGIADGAPNFSMRVFTLEAGGYTPYHNHPWEHENYVISGSGVIRTADGQERPISAGDFIFISPGEQHQFRNNADEELQFICLVPKEQE
ncbi:MAG: cupin domain-containing protein [Spirochaetaceae bacterium]